MPQQDTVRVARTPFAMVPRWLVRSSVSDRAIRLYALITEYAHRGDDVTRQELADALATSVRSVDRAMRELEDLGALQVHHRFQGNRQLPSLYRPLFDEPGWEPGGGGDTGVAGDTGDAPGAPPVTHRVRETGDRTERETRAQTSLLDDEPQPKATRRKPERPIPDGWQPDDRVREWAAENAPGVDVDAEAGRFVDHALSVDRRARDWTAAFRNWLRKARPAPGANGRAEGPGRRYEGAESHDAGYWTPEGAALLVDEEDDRG